MIDLGDWKGPLAPLFADERYKKIREFLKYEYSHYVVYPDMYDLYNCFRFTPFANVKVVLLGQDPYHEPGQAHGLCFSVKEGVLLMNTALTVREHQANSHANCGWSWFTDSVIQILSEKKEHLVFQLWGGNARRKRALIDTKKHLVLECAHPSPLSAYNGFFGCKHFSKTNAYLEANAIPPIDWDLNS